MADTDGLTVLLGAGASYEAGLPMSFDLTRRIAEEVETSGGRHSGATLALNIAIGAMIAHDTARGKDAFSGIDVERLFSAIQMLSQRDAVELTPFVASWNAALEAVGRSGDMPSSFKSRFSRSLLSGADQGFDAVFRQGVKGVLGQSSEVVFGELQTQMLSALQSLLAVDPAAVDYLRPLLSACEGPIQIATLNYDRTIEVLAQRADRKLDTGVGNWSGGFDWSWSDSTDVRLLKLHGSIDWWYVRSRPKEGRLAEDHIEVDPVGRTVWAGSRLAIVFGQRGKLRSDGPFLAMLRGFDDFLASSKRLVIVGYSFRDEHINASIRRWYNGMQDPHLTIVDPSLEGLRRYGASRSEFLSEVLNAISLPPNSPRRGVEVRSPHQVLGLPASIGLRDCFGDGPELAPGVPELPAEH